MRRSSPQSPQPSPRAAARPPRKRVRAMTVTEQIDRIVLGIKYAYDLSVADETAARRRVLMAVTRILASCNRDDLPEALEIVAAQMAEAMLRDDGTLTLPQQVSSVTRGDTSISYRDQSSSAKATRDYLQDYEDILWRYRKPGVPRREEP